MLVLPNVIIEPLNVRKKKKKTIKCDKSKVTYNVGTTQCEDKTVKCEKKNKGITKCDKSTIKCDVDTVECDNGTIKCEKKNKETIKC